MRPIFMLFLLIVSCSTRQPDTINSSPKEVIKTNEITRNDKEQIDSLLFNDVKINDVIPLKLKESVLLEKLGQPDSVINVRNDCGNYLDGGDSSQVYYYGLSRFIVSKGEALLNIFYPDKKLSFGTSNFKINGEASESEFKKLFPKSYANMIYRIENKRIGERRLKVGMIKNPISPYDNGFIFYFENEKLIRIELWWFIC
ncbi:MAG: hypothetical protein AB9846_13975 [Tenuifilaceae bacterium]